MFGSLPPELLMMLQQSIPGFQLGGMPGLPQQQPQTPKTRFSGPLGRFGLLAQQLGGGSQQGFLPQRQERPIDNLPPWITPTIPSQNTRRGIPKLPGLLGGY